MGLIKDLREALRAERDKRRKQQQKYRIEYAFTSGGTKYYRYADIANLPYERGLSAMCVYDEITMRCSREYLTKHVEAMQQLLKSKEIDIFRINTLNEVLAQRLRMTTDVNLMYKLASIVFFDKTENPLVYEPEYAEKKIAKWRKDKGVHDFFMQTPLLDLMPFLRNVGVDLDIYTRLNDQLNQLQQEILHTVTSTNE